MPQKLSEELISEINSLNYPTQEKAIWINTQSPALYRKIFEDSHFKIPKSLKKFLSAVASHMYEVAMTNPEKKYCDQSEFIPKLKALKIGASTSNMSEKFTALVKLDILRLATVDQRNQNLKRIFVLCDIIELEQYMQRPEGLENKDHLLELEDKKMTGHELKQKFVNLASNQELMSADLSQLSSTEESFSAYTYKTFLALSSCMRMSSRSNKNYYAAERQLGKATLRLSAKSDDEYGICTIGDQQTIYTITTLCIYMVRSYIELKAQVANDFLLDLVDLCKFSGRTSVGSNRATINKAIHRLYHTVFKIEIDGTAQDKIDVANIIDIAGMDNNNLRFLTELNTDLDVKTGDPEQKRNPRWIRISLNQRTFQKIVEKETARHRSIHQNDVIDVENPVFFQANKEILHYSNGLVHLLIQHLNVVIGRHGHRPLKILGKNFRPVLAPSAPVNTFNRLLIQAFQSLYTKSRKRNASVDWVPSGVNRIRTLGYHMAVETFNGEIESAIFTRDRNDLFNGDDTAHKKIERITRSNKSS